MDCNLDRTHTQQYFSHTCTQQSKRCSTPGKYPADYDVALMYDVPDSNGSGNNHNINDDNNNMTNNNNN